MVRGAVATNDGSRFGQQHELFDTLRRDREYGCPAAMRGGEWRERCTLQADLGMHARKVGAISGCAQVTRDMRARRCLRDQQRDQRQDRDRPFQQMEIDVPAHRGDVSRTGESCEPPCFS